MSGKKITKSNAIINASYRLSLNELRIILYGLSHINPRSNEFPLFHTINMKELAEFYDIGQKDRGSFYQNIQEALIKKFWERDFSYFDNKVGKVVKRRWLIEVQYGGEDNTLAYHYNPMIKDELQQLAKRFTSYFLTNVANMKSAYSIRIYEIAIMYLNASKKQKTVFNKKISDLKTYLDIEDKYVKFSNFKSRVLEKAKAEINIFSDIKLNYEIVKTGKKPTEVKFTVVSKEEVQKLPQYTQLKISSKSLYTAKKLALSAGTGWDVSVIEQQFYGFIEAKGKPDNIDAAFIGFVKKKIEQPA